MSSLADWLTLHGMDARTCRHLLALEAEPVAASPVDPVWPMPGRESWALVRGILQEALGDAIAGPAARVIKLNLSEPSQTARKRPRGLTLHDDGTGAPLVHVRLTGRISDLLVMAHEFGHACQIVACPDMPPILRETCAFVAETLLIGGMLKRGVPDAESLPGLFRARGMAAHERSRQTLLGLLDQPDARYDLGWNYPCARRLLQRVPTDRLEELFCGNVTVADLIRP